MSVPLTIIAIIVFAAIGSDAQPNPKTRAIVQFLDRMISQGNRIIASAGKSMIVLPDFGTLPKDPLMLRHGRLGNFSSLELCGWPSMTERRLPNGSSALLLEFNLGLAQFHILYDYYLRYYDKRGNISIDTKDASIDIKAALIKTPKEGCKGSLISAEVKNPSNFEVVIKPGISEKFLKIAKDLSSSTASSLLPILNLAISSFLVTPNVQESFSTASCQAIYG